MIEDRQKRLPAVSTVVVAIGFVLLYVGVSLAARAHGADFQFLPWDAGIALSFALLARMGARWAPLVVAASLAAAFARAGSGGLSPPAVWSACAEALACSAAALVLRSPEATIPDLNRVRPVVRLFFSVATASALNGLASAVAMVTGGEPSEWEIALTSGRSFLSSATALIMVAPVLLMPALGRQEPMRRPLISAETFLQSLALAVVSWEVFGRFVNEEIHFFYVLFLPLGWIATRHGQSGAVVAIAVVYLAPLVSDWFVPHREQAIIELQIRLCVLGVTALLIGAMGSERRLTQERMLARQAELAHVQRLNVGWEMASALAHEINQPVTAAMNYTQAALRMISAPAPDLERVSAVMRKGLDQVERVGQIVHGLRDFMNKGELRLARTDISETVDDAIRLVSAEASATGVKLDVGGLAPLPSVMADKTQLVQILVNLIRNAIQALAAARPGSGAVTVTGRVGGNNVEIIVADNGPGIAPEIRDRLFTPFVTTKTSGMGLGLSISRSIAEAHHGQLTVESLASGGTAFHIVLPAAVPEPRDA